MAVTWYLHQLPKKVRLCQVISKFLPFTPATTTGATTEKYLKHNNILKLKNLLIIMGFMPIKAYNKIGFTVRRRKIMNEGD